MTYSTIVKKKCKCGRCNHYPTLGFDGYFYLHAPEEIKERQGEKSKKSVQARINRQKTAVLSRKLHTVQNEADAKNKPEITPQGQWYLDRRIEMTNCCIECGAGTRKAHNDYFTWSICHITPKSLVPSVAMDINNWVELCWLHHQEFDNTFDKAAAMQCFPEVKQKFQLFKHLIPPQELRKVNPHLLT
jgi:5-methylcytosine-specific restriction endonuclease McrA